MNPLNIGRWHTRYRADDMVMPDDLRAWDEAPRRMGTPRAAETEAIVCVRHVHIETTARPSDSAALISELLEQALDARLAELIAGPPAEGVVIWRDRRDALADMLYRASIRDLGRTWAWRQIGLLLAGAEAPRAVRPAAVAALAEAPDHIWPVLARLILAEPETGALSALLAAMTPSDWEELFHVRPGAVARADGAAWPGRSRATSPHVGPSPSDPALSGPVAQALLSWATRQPLLARRSRPVLTALLAMASFPAAAGSRRFAPEHLARAAAALDRVLGTAAPPPGVRLTDRAAPEDRANPARTAPPDAAPMTSDDTPSDPTDPALPSAPPLPEPDAPLFSPWAGLLFLIPLLPAAGFLDRTEPVPDGLADALTAIALAIGVPGDDPAIRAFRADAVLTAMAAAARPTIPTPFREIVTETIAALEELLSDRLGPPEPGGWLVPICRRDGAISIEPGWIEIEFPAESADTALRRAAIDLDPGFVPWLGCVVRYRYV